MTDTAIPEGAEHSPILHSAFLPAPPTESEQKRQKAMTAVIYDNAIGSHKIKGPTAPSWYGNEGNYTYRGDHLLMHIIIESPCCTSETNLILCINYVPIKKN